MRRSEEPVTVDGTEDQKVAGREHHGTDRRALEARPASLWVGHWDSSVPAGPRTQGRRLEPPSQRSIFRSPSSRGRPYRSRERRITAACLPLALPWMGGRV